MSLREAVEPLFEQSVVQPRVWRNGQTGRTLPIDLYATKNAYILQANVPGVDPNNVNITIEGSTLSIRGDSLRCWRDGYRRRGGGHSE